MQWEVVIGLETHVQLSTVSKIFSGASTHFGAEPNTQACPVDLALPGVLPVMNRGAVEKAIQFGLAIGAHVAPLSVFARKNYFYPDLPKGYQISQFEKPVVQGGKIHVGLINRFQLVMKGFGLAQAVNGLLQKRKEVLRIPAGRGFPLNPLLAGQIPAAVYKTKATVRQQHGGKPGGVQWVGREKGAGASCPGLLHHQRQGGGGVAVKGVDLFT